MASDAADERHHLHVDSDGLQRRMTTSTARINRKSITETESTPLPAPLKTPSEHDNIPETDHKEFTPATAISLRPSTTRPAPDHDAPLTTTSRLAPITKNTPLRRQACLLTNVWRGNPRQHLQPAALTASLQWNVGPE
ncbi:hypothetical protein J1614_000027 [Plenodomus biglobosus]|nr:hypothetical protein J1614_000027 [Plenodomus biglobosus]